MNAKNLKNLVLGFTLGSFGLVALAVTIPNTFTSGSVISSSQMNVNFAAVKTAVDALEAKAAANSGIAANLAKKGVAVSGNSSAMSDVILVSITTPAQGQIVLNFTAQATIRGAANVDCYIASQIDEAPGGPEDPDNVVNAGFGALPNASIILIPVSIQRVYTKNAGSYRGFWFGCESHAIPAPSKPSPCQHMRNHPMRLTNPRQQRPHRTRPL